MNNVYLTGVIVSITDVIFDVFNKCDPYIEIIVRDLDEYRNKHEHFLLIISKDKLIEFASKHLQVGTSLYINGYIDTKRKISSILPIIVRSVEFV